MTHSDPVSLRNNLYDTLLSDLGLEGFVSAASGILKRSVLLVGADHRYLASCLRPGTDLSAQVLLPLSEELQAGHLSPEALTLLKEERVEERIKAQSSPEPLTLSGLPLTLLACPVRIHGVTAAHVLLLSSQVPFRREEAESLVLLARLTGQELQKSPFPDRPRSPLSEFLSSLLATSTPQRHLVEHQLEVLGRRLRGSYCIAVIEPDGRTFTGRDFEMVEQHLRGVLTGTLSTVRDGRLVVLFDDLCQKKLLSPYKLRTLRRVAMEDRLTIGVSNLGEDILEIRRYYRQAIEAVRYGRTFMKNSALKPVCLYYEYCYGELLDACVHHLNLLDYVYPPLLDLLRYDQENASFLMDTLFQYLLHNANTALTAKSMSIHKNTILYRLNLIRDIIGNDLSAGEDLFIINLSLRILTQLQLFTPQKVTDKYDMSSAGLDRQLEEDL